MRTQSSRRFPLSVGPGGVRGGSGGLGRRSDVNEEAHAPGRLAVAGVRDLGPTTRNEPVNEAAQLPLGEAGRPRPVRAAHFDVGVRVLAGPPRVLPAGHEHERHHLRLGVAEGEGRAVNGEKAPAHGAIQHKAGLM